jgi:hypothetical protein
LLFDSLALNSILTKDKMLTGIAHAKSRLLNIVYDVKQTAVYSHTCAYGEHIIILCTRQQFIVMKIAFKIVRQGVSLNQVNWARFVKFLQPGSLAYQYAKLGFFTNFQAGSQFFQPGSILGDPGVKLLPASESAFFP